MDYHIEMYTVESLKSDWTKGFKEFIVKFRAKNNLAFALVALFSKCVKMQWTLFDAGLKCTNTITNVDNSPDSSPKRSCHLSESKDEAVICLNVILYLGCQF